MDDQGRVAVVVSLCDGEHVYSLYVEEAIAAAEERRKWSASLPFQERPSGESEFPLLVVPPGWRVPDGEPFYDEGLLEPITVDNDLTELHVGVRYAAVVETGGFRGNQVRSTGLEFELGEIHSLSDGEVLVASKGDIGEVRTVSEFATRARTIC